MVVTGLGGPSLISAFFLISAQRNQIENEAKIQHDSLIHVTDAINFTLRTSAFSSSESDDYSTLHFNLFSLDNSTVDLTDVTITQLEFSSSTLFYTLSSSSLTLLSVIVTNLTLVSTLFSYPSISNSKLTLMTSHFYNLHLTSVDSPTVLTSSSSLSVAISQSSFSNLLSLHPSGAALILQGPSIISDTLFSESSKTASSSFTSLTNTVTDVCEWSGSAVLITGVDASSTITSSNFTSYSAGALEISDHAQAVLTDCFFQSNTPSIDDFSFVRRNVLCTDSSLVLESLIESDDTSTQAGLWIHGMECSFDGSASSFLTQSTYFVPSLVSVEKSTDSADALTLHFTGSRFLPCSLFVTIVVSDDTNITFDPPVVTSSEEASYELTDTQFTQYHNASTASVCLSFTDNGVIYNTTSFTLKSPQNLSRSTALGTGVLAGIIAAIAALLLALFLCCLCFFCCCQKRKAAEQQSETEESDALMSLIQESQKKEVISFVHHAPFQRSFLDTLISMLVNYSMRRQERISVC